MELAYYPGCSLRASSGIYDLQCNLVLPALGLNLRELDDWNCCGATSAAKVDEFMAAAMPARNLGIADATGCAGLVIPCSACYSRMLTAREMLGAEPGLLAEINAELSHKITGKTRILSILEAVQLAAGPEELAERALRRLEGVKPVCYYGCMLTRFPWGVRPPDDVENPRAMETILEALGAAPLDWSSKTDCCGASAAVNDAETSLALMSGILEEAFARKANCLVTTCPMCQFNLDAYQRKAASACGADLPGMPVYFITELIGAAFGLRAEDLGVGRHFVDALTLLRDLNLHE